MTPQQIEQQDTARQTAWLDGSSDAAMGESPAHPDDPEYLAGYLDALRILIQTKGHRLQIRWVSEAWIYGAYDSPDPCSCDCEF